MGLSLFSSFFIKSLLMGKNGENTKCLQPCLHHIIIVVTAFNVELGYNVQFEKKGSSSLPGGQEIIESVFSVLTENYPIS